jgi:hypothetical protein
VHAVHNTKQTTVDEFATLDMDQMRKACLLKKLSR